MACLIPLLTRITPAWILVLIKSNSQILKKMDYQRHEIVLNIDSEIERGTRLYSCIKEPETIHWIESSFQRGDVFYDIGANVGAYSLVAAKFCQGDIKVYSFEPGFMTFPQLCKNIFANGVQDSVLPLQIALSNKTCLDTFNYHNLTPGGAIHTLGEPIDYKGDVFRPVARQQVLSFRIDDLIQQFQIPAPNHMKLDVDGIESDVLHGAEDALANPLFKTLIMELEEGSKESTDIIEYLSTYGLKFQTKHKYALGGDGGPFSKVYNYIFQK